MKKKSTPIALEDLKEGMICSQTICDNRGMILIGRGVKLTKAYIQGLQKFKVSVIDIQDESQEEVIENLPVLKAKAQECVNSITGLIEDIDKYRTVKISKNASRIEQVLYSVLEKSSIQDFLEAERQNEVLYKHSLRTTILSIIMGINAGYNFLNLEYLAMGALLHDCGMGRFFKEDNDAHSFLGFLKIRNNAELDMIVAMICLQHHERFDGSGFPFQFKKTESIEFARLLAVADHYDRLLMQQFTPREAVFDVLSGGGTLFDKTMVELFSSTMA